MVLGKFEPFEYETEPRPVRRRQCAKRAAVAAMVCSGVVVLLTTTLAITALRNCDILREDQLAIVEKLETLSQRLESFQYGNNNVTHSVHSTVASSGETKLKHVERMIEVLTHVMAVSKTSLARVFQPKVWPEVNTSQILSCESSGDEPLSYCLWGRTVDGQYEMVLIDKGSSNPSDDRPSAGRIYYNEDDLDEGKCEVRIASFTLKDFGTWSCTLVAQTGEIFTGSVNVETTRSVLTVPDLGPAIYFTNVNGSIKAYSPGTSELFTVINNKHENFIGMAYDSLTDKLYWSANFRNGTWSICRANRNGTGLESALQEHELIFELAFDWITGNLYAVSLNGVIFVCDPSRAGITSCVSILSNQGKIEGIALNPIAGLMYFSSGDSIVRAEMDGTDKVPNFIQVNATRGLFIDLEDSRLYWSSTTDKLIQSSDLAGGDIRTIVHLGPTSHPQGIAVMGDRIYWTDHYVGKLESSYINGTDVRTLYDGADKIMHLVVAPIESRYGNRTNDCEQRCYSSIICVLNANSFRCLNGSVEDSGESVSSEELDFHHYNYDDHEGLLFG